MKMDDMEWLAIDRLHAEAGDRILYWDGEDMGVAEFHNNRWSRKGDDYDLVVEPTHWMPLPAPPTPSPP